MIAYDQRRLDLTATEVSYFRVHDLAHVLRVSTLSASTISARPRTTLERLTMSMIGNYLKLSPEQLEEVIRDPERAENFVYPEDENYPADALDIDKSWHLIHFLLNGETWGGVGPLSNAVLGGQELPDTDAGYGPFRYLRPEEVKATATAFAEISPATLWARFDAQAAEAAEIYPTPWAGDDGDRDYVLHNFEALRKYFLDASSSDSGMLLYLS